MEKEFVPYELALRLKELGFDEPCFGYYKHEELLIEGKYKNSDHGFSVSAPTWQSAFRWFRETHSLIGAPNHYGGLNHPNMTCNYKISGNTKTGQRIFSHLYDNYEDSQFACLEKLIEIVEPKLN